MQFFPLITTAAFRPSTLTEVTFHIASDTGIWSVGWVDSTGTTRWLNTAGAIIGILTSFITYLGGTVVPSTLKTANFTASASEATEYQLTAANINVALSSTDLNGTRYEFSALASIALPNITFTPNGGKTISGPGPGPLFAQASLTVTAQGAWRCVEKQSDGNWLMSGL